MKKLFKSFLILSAIAMAIPCFAQTPNTLTKKEKKAGWELLFNGKTSQDGVNVTEPLCPRTGL